MRGYSLMHETIGYCVGRFAICQGNVEDFREARPDGRDTMAHDSLVPAEIITTGVRQATGIDHIVRRIKDVPTTQRFTVPSRIR